MNTPFTKNSEDEELTYEHAVIGCILMDSNCAAKALSTLSEEDFTGVIAAETFSELKEIYKNHKRIDMAIISKSKNKDFIIKCAEYTPSISAFEIYIKQIKEYKIKTKAKELAREIIDDNLQIEDIAGKAGEIARITTGSNSDTKTQGITDLILEFMGTHKLGTKTEYLRLGFGLDGFVRTRKGNYIIIGARPSVGKTAFSIQMAINLAKSKLKVLYCSLETNKKGIIERIISCYGNYNFGDLQDNKINWDDVRYGKMLDEIAQLPICVNDRINNVSIIEAEACAGGYDVVFIDYMGLLDLGRKTNTIYEKVTETSIMLHKMAQKNNILVVCLCQLNREGVGIPRLEHLKDSGQIEQDADVIIMLHSSKQIGSQESANPQEEFFVVVEKNKTGRCGTIKLDYEKECQRFFEIDDRQEP